MGQLLKRVNMELAAKLAISAILASAVIVTGANAIDSGIDAENAVHANHKAWLDDNTSDKHVSDMTLEEYEASQQAQDAAHANDVLAKAYGRKS